MARKVLFAAAAALLAAACSYRSSVDLVPFETRPEAPPIAAGVYCGLDVLRDAETTADPAECGRIDWNAERREYAVSDLPEDDDGPDIYAVRQLEPCVLVVERDSGEGEAPYEINTLVVAGDAFSVVFPVEDVAMEPLMARHPGVEFGELDDDFYIRGGSMADIDSFLADATRVALAEQRDRDEDVEVTVLAGQGGDPGPLSAAQSAAAADVRAKAAELAAQAAPAP